MLAVLKNQIFVIEMGAKRPVYVDRSAARSSINSISCFVRALLHRSVHRAPCPGDKAPIDQLCSDPSGLSWSES